MLKIWSGSKLWKIGFIFFPKMGGIKSIGSYFPQNKVKRQEELRRQREGKKEIEIFEKKRRIRKT